MRLFNERGFDRGVALYDGELLGWPFRAVVKTFQVKVWRRLLDEWRALVQGGAGRAPDRARMTERQLRELLLVTARRAQGDEIVRST